MRSARPSVARSHNGMATCAHARNRSPRIWCRAARGDDHEGPSGEDELPPGLLSFDPSSMDSRGVAVAPRGARPIVVLPGFGNNMSDYTAPFGCPEEGLATQLQERGWHVEVLDIERKNWLNVARNLLTLGVWNGTLTTNPGYRWYIEKIAESVLRAQEATGHEKVHLVGHSAGGWLARAFVGGASGSGVDPRGHAIDSVDDASLLLPHPAVASLTTLGTPHRPPPPAASPEGKPKARDMTGGALTWVDANWPGGAFQEAGVKYVAVAGRAVQGCAKEASGKERTLRGYAHASYMQVCGEGDGVWGDCVVPLTLATLDGATNVVLEGVRHSMARIGTWDERGASDHVWYGSAQVLDSWLYHLVDADAGLEPAGGRDPAERQREGAIVLPGGTA